MKFRELVKGLIHVEFKSQHDLCSTLLRFQEYYESPKFKGIYFSLKDFKDYYRAVSLTGKFTYYSDFSGFNFPGSALSFVDYPAFRASKKEDIFLKKLNGLIKKNKIDTDNFYVIATVTGDDPNTLLHELSHALFSIDSTYKKKSTDIVSSLKDVEAFKVVLGQIYHESVFTDEIAAYLMADISYIKEKWDIESSEFNNASILLKALFNRRWDALKKGASHKI